jgi:putrescine aminotransferase
LEPDSRKALHRNPTWKTIPFDLPEFLLCNTSVRLFNGLHYHRQLRDRKGITQRYDRFFFPLDAVRKWNRLYGRRGFLQWQCVLPFSAGYDGVSKILNSFRRSGPFPFLAVIKEFGAVPARGMLSFPMPGITLALDFANVGDPLFRLLGRLDILVEEAGGRLYPAKDARMSGDMFRHTYANLSQFERYRDPKLSSSFCRRVRLRCREPSPRAAWSPSNQLNTPQGILSRGAKTMNLLSLEEAAALGPKQARELYRQHVNAGLLTAFTVLGFGDLDIESAEGVEIRLRNGRILLDFSSAIGVLGLGHNHPRILAAERFCHEHKLIDAFKVGPLKLQAALAHNLAQMLPDPLEVSFFTTSGAEAVEAAMKLCEKAQGPHRKKFITTRNAFHGKTHGALSLTRTEGFQDGFLLGVPSEHIIEVPFGDVGAVRQVIAEECSRHNTNPIIAIFIEPIQGQGLVEAPPGYLRDIADLCRHREILIVFDEVKVGMGRTGAFCAFEHHGVVPDVVTLSKALGGGKRAMGAMVTSRELFARAYGKRKDWASHTTTFGGLGETCAVAIETLNIFRSERIVEAVRHKGDYLKTRLLELKAKHPDSILEVRGRGLLQGVRFNFNSLGKRLANRFADSSKWPIFKTIDGILMASIIRELVREHHIVTHFAPSDPDLLHVMPPLIVETHHLDHFVQALDQVLSKNILELAAGFLKD